MSLLWACGSGNENPGLQVDLALENLQVLDVQTGAVLEQQSVLIQGQEIVWLGPQEESPLESASEVVDGQGGFLMPGLYDAHVHLSREEQLSLLVAFGITGARDMGGRPELLQWAQEIDSQQRLGPALSVVSPILDGDPPVFPGHTVIASASQARARAAELAEQGYQALKVYTGLNPEAYQALQAAGMELGLSVVGHVPVQVGLEGALELGQASLEHLMGYSQALEDPGAALQDPSSHRHLYGAVRWDLEALPGIASRTRQAGAWNCPTLIALDRWVPIEEARPWLTQEILRYVPPEQRAQWLQGPAFLTRFLQGSSPELRQLGRQNRRLLVRELASVRAGLLAGTDAGSPYVLPGLSLHEELETMVQAGLSPLQALKSATFDPARFEKRQARSGTVQAGKRADLLLLRRNPLEDIRATRQIEGVVLAGQWLNRQDLTRLLGQVEQAFQE